MVVWPAKRARLHLALAWIMGAWIAYVAWARGPIWSPVAGPVLATLYYHLTLRRYLWRRKLVARPFPEDWRAQLELYVAFYRCLDEEGRRRFETDVRIFMDEQEIYGVRGAEVPDEVQLMIASAAAMLGHGRPDWEWPRLRDIVVYPTGFDGEYRMGPGETFSGMVHQQGPILISERDLKHGFHRPSDGGNVALHELAHVIDMADGAADGVPRGLGWISTAPWVELVAERLRCLRAGECRRVLRPYAEENEVEFFAVAVEAFFEQPMRLRNQDRQLYDLLAEYFNLDTAEMRESC